MNELHLNTATMIEIVQMWIDMDMPVDKPIVTDIKSVDGNHYLRPMFVVELNSDKQYSID